MVPANENLKNFKHLKDVHLNITKNDETCVQWLKSMNLMAPDPSPCPNCEASDGRKKGQLKIYYSGATDRKCGLFMQCQGVGAKCRYRASPFTHTFFDGRNCKLTVCEVVDIVWCWVNRLPVRSCIAITGNSKKTIIDYYNFCREITAVSLVNGSDNVIGGVGFTVEIDESKLFKRKYNRGRVLSMQEGWAFGGVCRETKAKFAELVPDRSEETLLPLILKYIKPGTTIMSDEWRAYYNLNKYIYIFIIKLIILRILYIQMITIYILN